MEPSAAANDQRLIEPARADLFILGAGFSKAVSEQMPTLRELGVQLQNRMGLHDGVLAPNRFGGDVELWLSYLAQRHPWLSESASLRNRAMFLDISTALSELIHACVRRTDPEGQPGFPAWFSELTQYWMKSAANVVTVNYDILVELACLTEYGPNGATYAGGLVPMHQRTGSTGVWLNDPPGFLHLIKLHGSINWYYSGVDTFAGSPSSTKKPIRFSTAVSNARMV